MIGDLSMADVLQGETESKLVKTVTRTTNDFVESESIAGRQVDMLVQPADPKRLQSDDIDWALEYIMVHALQEVAVGEYVEHKGKDFKIISRTPWTDYGYDELLGEETKQSLLQVNA